MIATNIFGQYAFQDLPSIPVASVTESDLFGQLEAFAAAESAAMNELSSLLADQGTNLQETTGYVSGGQMQRISEYAQPEATRRGGSYTVAFPIWAWGDRKVYTPAFLSRATLATLNADAIEAALKDVNTVLIQMFGALTNKTNFTFTDSEWPGINAGSLAIKRLANADGQVGYTYFNGQQVSLATEQSYKTSGSATIATSQFTTIKSTLTARGYGDDVVCIISFNDGETIKNGLLGANFVPVPDPKLSVLPTTQTPIVSSPRAIGRVGGCELQVWPHWPDGYTFGFDRSKQRPLRIRNSPIAGEVGFRLVADETRGGERPGRPLQNKYWQRVFGVAVRNRFNGVMMQQTTSGTYTNPTIA